ncbi:SDR family NAD(P)-dependent oxidoreductase [Arthrobacter sp. MA-N2]|uniref:SDR family NAD(P)-dependent oxidoreductase n=1 Tax=Arthrobacter sp. MA-N2 TaxID=1101188 RepID=UPI000489ED6A|nr:SDR family oxidoreductase [Arthrobacter sp. MA-N2]
MDMDGRTVLVTGGTSGTGLRAAERFLAKGANVVINGRDPGRGRQALAGLRTVSEDAGTRTELVLGDCAAYKVAAAAVAAAVERFGGVDVLVSAGATGRGDPKPFAEMTPEEVTGGLESRYRARMFPVHAAIPHLRGREGANIVLLTTDAARHTTVGESVIGAYAAGIIQLTKSLGRELSRERIRVNAVSMTLTSETRSWEHIFGDDSFQSGLFGKAISKFPFGAPPTAGDVAEAVAFLASPAASQITGQTLSVNGGLSFGGW